MTNPSLSPAFLPTATFPTLPLAQLSEDEARIANFLAMRLFDQRPYLELRGLYYDGLQRMQDLGISIPPSLAGLRTVIGWPQVGVDAVDERLYVEGFRYPGSSDTDEDLWGIWQANNMDGEHLLAQLDALIYGRAYIVAGVDDDGAPLLTCESPLNLGALWDARMRKVTAALQIYLDTDFTSDMYGQEVAALYLPGRTIQMARSATAGGAPLGATGAWEIVTRDNHGIVDVPVVRLANRQRLANRDGLSEITPAVMNVTDSACRTMLGMEVGREFHAAPRRYVLGAAEENFTKPDGTPATAWDTYMSKVFMIERDEEGEIPTVGQFPASDPSTYTKLIDTYTHIMAGLFSVPPEYLGMTTNGNPTSADAIRAQEARLVKRVQRKQAGFSDAWEQALRLAVLIRDGSLPDGAERIETDWADPSTPTPQATSQALSMQVAAGMVPPRSDVILKRAGYSAVERRQMARDWANDPGAEFVREAASLVEGRDVVEVARIAKATGADPTQLGAQEPQEGASNG
ncbi:MAG TPA: phage portal protein [Mycobacteriales bacterium]|nr:phage portal protein [Mycobacteriales bacterium]